MIEVNRRELLTLGGLTLAGTALAPTAVRAQTPKRGGTLNLRLWDEQRKKLIGFRRLRKMRNSDRQSSRS